MKKLIIFLIIMFPLRDLGSTCFAQIFSNKSINRSIEITPLGISDKMFTLSSTNTGLGEDALAEAFSVLNNTAIGWQALNDIASNFPNDFNGNNNTSVGYFSLAHNVQGYNNTALGFFTLVGTGICSNSNTAFGKSAMSNSSSSSYNDSFGAGSLTNIKTGNGNSSFGDLSMTLNQSSDNNLAFGFSAFQNHTTNDNNIALGASALYLDKSGENNLAIGNNAMRENVSGSSNTAVGMSVMTNGKIGTGNAALGGGALNANDGQNNTTAGYTALEKNSTGSNNVALGPRTLYQNIAGSGNVAIGHFAGFNETGSNKLYIDNALSEFGALVPIIGGDFAANKVCIACNMSNTGVNDFNTRSETFQVTGNAFKTLGSGSWKFPSDRRLKENIVSLESEEMLNKILAMQGVNYELIASPEQGMQYGFIAQDLQKIFPTKVYENKSGYLSSSYGDYVPMFVEAIKALNERVEKLENRDFDIQEITAKIERLERQVYQQ